MSTWNVRLRGWGEWNSFDTCSHVQVAPYINIVFDTWFKKLLKTRSSHGVKPPYKHLHLPFDHIQTKNVTIEKNTIKFPPNKHVPCCHHYHQFNQIARLPLLILVSGGSQRMSQGDGQYKTYNQREGLLICEDDVFLWWRYLMASLRTVLLEDMMLTEMAVILLWKCWYRLWIACC